MNGKERPRRDSSRQEALAFAARRLGPASARRLAQDDAIEAVEERIDAGATPANAVLAELHLRARSDAALAAEFVAYFLSDMRILGRAALRPGLRRHLDTSDLVDSVVRDLWPELAALRFETRAGFLQLLAQRLRWKAAERAREQIAGRRREDLRVYPEAGLAEAEAREPAPPERAMQEEVAARLRERVAALPRAEREVLEDHLQDLPAGRISQRLGCSEAEVKALLKRALRRLRAGAPGRP